MNIGVLGAWSIDNAGDALIGLATRRALRARFPAATIRAFAPRFSGASWRHDTSAAHGMDGPIELVPVDDLAWTRELDALVIGGGGVVNFVPAFRAFLLAAPGLADLPVAWNGVCSQNTPAYGASADDRALVRRCCERLAYASVRNRTTHTFARTCGYAGELHVVPDAAFDASLDEKARDRSGGSDGSPPFTLALSLGNAFEDARAAGYYDALFAEVGALVAARGGRLVLLPFGRLYGDIALVQRAAGKLAGAEVVQPSSPLDAWRAVGAADLYIGARLHAVIAAIVQEVPFVVADEYLSDQMATSKLRELIVDLGLEAHYTCPFITRTPAPKLALAAQAIGTRPFSAIVAAQRARLDEHWSAMSRALGLPC
ncbi:MAG: polysaccharide pyruvyl transferase family protein [Kofleriaceae bacterium]